jgi:hypothetical protein
MIFLFNVEDLVITTYSDEDIKSEGFAFVDISPEMLAADAEKAFIKIMQCKYNTQKYAAYPKSLDGLYPLGFDRYSFIINECISFKTKTARVRGARFYEFNKNDEPDFIAIDQNSGSVDLITPEYAASKIGHIP